MNKLRISLIAVITLSFNIGFTQTLELGEDRYKCDDSPINLTPSIDVLSNNICFNWKALIGGDSSISCKGCQNISVNPQKKETYVLTGVGPNFSFRITDTVDVFTIDSVIFKQNENQLYGYDDYTDQQNHCKSIKENSVDFVDIEVFPGEAKNGIYIQSTNESIITVDHTIGSKTISITSLGPGEATILARCGSSTGPILASLKILSYPLKHFKLAYRVVADPEAGFPIIDDAIFNSIKTDLNNLIFNQAVSTWDIVKESACIVDYDQNDNLILDYEVETNIIHTSCSLIGYDAIMYIVPDIQSSEEDFTGGFALRGTGAFFVDILGAGSIVAHEIGHGTFSFGHTPDDDKGLMHPDYSQERIKLRKSQWSIIQSH